MFSLEQAFTTASKRLASISKSDLVLFVLRHGESRGQKDLSLYKELGDERIPLTPTGYKQSRNAGLTLSNLLKPFSHKQPIILTSTGERSLITGVSIMHAMIRQGFTMSFIPDTRLDKQKFGKFDGLFTDDERRYKWPKRYAEFKKQEQTDGVFFARPPEGESIADVQNRLQGFLQEIPFDNSPRIIVTHGTNTLCIENILMNRGEEWLLSNLDKRKNCAVRMLVGNFKDGFDVMDIEDNAQNLDKPLDIKPKAV